MTTLQRQHKLSDVPDVPEGPGGRLAGWKYLAGVAASGRHELSLLWSSLWARDMAALADLEVERPPVAVWLVHGYLGNRGHLLFWRRHLRRLWPQVEVELVSFRSTRLSVPDAGRQLAARVSGGVAAGGREGPVLLVGHSLGGLVVRWAAEVEQVGLGGGGVVTLGSPHGGVSAASEAGGRTLTALQPGSALLKMLGTVPTIDTLSVAARGDRVVSPTSSLLRGPQAQNARVDGSHGSLLHDPAVVETVVGWFASRR